MKPETLLERLTLEQKLAQFVAMGSPEHFVKDRKFDRERACRDFPHGLFGMMVPIDLTPCEIGEWVGDMMDCFAELSPVPPMLICESLHGILGQGTTVFPQSIGMGASFDPSLMQRVGDAIGREARALGIRMSLAPDLDLGREPRWGRIEETFGESPLLVGEMGEAYVKGLLTEDDRYAATVKHFAAHGTPESGINLAPVNVSLQDLEDKYLPPFKRALDAGAKCVMPAYSTLNGIPCHTHPLLMKNILRERWGFDGVVISDFGAVNMLLSFHHTTDDPVEAGLWAMDFGVDVQVPGLPDLGTLKRLVEDGTLSMELVDTLVLRILKLKADLGLSELSKPDVDVIRRTVRSDEHKALAREAARKSIVLMKNNGALPLKAGQTIAVVGPNAFSAQFGDYSLPKFDVKTPAQTLAERAESVGGSVISAKGCDVFGDYTTGFAEAEAAAMAADAVVCVIGGKSMKGYGVGWGSEEESILTCGEGCDMHDLVPGGPQLELVRKMIAVGKPVTVVMIDGRPETLLDVGDDCDALVAAWYPGEEGSAALAELLFGDANFSAKLPVTFPNHVGQTVVYHDRVPSAGGFYHQPGSPNCPGRDYVFASTKPAYEFGHGLGYSEIRYDALTAEYMEEGIHVTVDVSNGGTYDADEAVLAFIRDEVASFPQPVKKLAAIKRIPLAAGETVKVELDIPKEQLMFTGINMEKQLEKGWFSVMVGGLLTRVYAE